MSLLKKRTMIKEYSQQTQQKHMHMEEAKICYTRKKLNIIIYIKKQYISDITKENK